MAEYIEREALLANLKRQYGEDLGWQGTVNMSDVGMMIEDAPAADIAPRAEVVMDILDGLTACISTYMEHNRQSIDPGEDAFYDGMYAGFICIKVRVEFLKKAYTEDELFDAASYRVRMERELEDALAKRNAPGPRVMERAEFLEAARSCICGDRDEQYGRPERSFDAIAGMWNAYFSSLGKNIPQISAKDVAVMMALFKIARIATGTQKADSWIDAIGYLACGGEIAEKSYTNVITTDIDKE